MRMVVKDGSNGRGKQRTQMSGRIKLDWQMVGFRQILLISSIRIFVKVRNTNLIFLLSFFVLLFHFLQDLIRSQRSFSE